MFATAHVAENADATVTLDFDFHDGYKSEHDFSMKMRIGSGNRQGAPDIALPCRPSPPVPFRPDLRGTRSVRAPVGSIGHPIQRAHGTITDED